eukprot:CAMPEP_0172622232 /NCGR_PEP_ID=MMETSP1068-20121228/119000_1 /TAXON_ID=35684 /ORGANISM="Pseudopedinella elastica, Strain CCMP716" /LENGTH=34 /DNA_ID= /DNA_START= /DNA_END= /DNA_ORIENTATION=
MARKVRVLAPLEPSLPTPLAISKVRSDVGRPAAD